MEKITELYPKKILNQENSSQYEIVLRNESATQMEKEEVIFKYD